MVVDILILAIVMDIQTVFLHYQYPVQLKEGEFNVKRTNSSNIVINIQLYGRFINAVRATEWFIAFSFVQITIMQYQRNKHVG